ncbi:MAG: DNA-directed RNA polymerase subunit K [Candidatus Nanohaloarchaea archaeon]|jgi:DNA-directed RNA polymerase subunit K
MSYTRYEKARILGARSLQIAMGAPPFVDYDSGAQPLDIAKKELNEGKLPITVKS